MEGSAAARKKKVSSLPKKGEERRRSSSSSSSIRSSKRLLDSSHQQQQQDEVQQMRSRQEEQQQEEEGKKRQREENVLDNFLLDRRPPPQQQQQQQQQDGFFRFKSRRSPPASKAARPKGGTFCRSPRYMRSSPSPPPSFATLESCLTAQLRFDGELDAKLSARPSLFHPYAGGFAPPRLAEEAEEASAGSEQGFNRPPLHLVNSRAAKAGGWRRDALFFSVGVGVGLCRALACGKCEELGRLQSHLEDAEATVRSLRMQLEEAARLKRNEAGGAAQGNMAELEAQLEAELELMQQRTTETREEDTSCSSGHLDPQRELVVHEELTASGLPGLSEDEIADDSYSGYARSSSWSVCPKELEQRLRVVLERRQEERINELESELERMEAMLEAKEQELQAWKERVRELSEGRGESRQEERSQEICDEFLRSVDEEDEDSSDEVQQRRIIAVAPKLTDVVVMNHAGANTPLKQQQRLQRRRQRSLSVGEKIKYWESLAKCSTQRVESSSISITASDSDNTSDGADEEDENDHGLMKRLLEEKAKRGSNLVRQVQVMLTALDAH